MHELGNWYIVLVNTVHIYCKQRMYLGMLHLCRARATQQRARETQGSQWRVTYRGRYYSNTLVVSTLSQYVLPTPTSASCHQVALCRRTRCPLVTTALILARHEHTRCCLTARVCHVTIPDQYSWSVSSVSVTWYFLFRYLLVLRYRLLLHPVSFHFDVCVTTDDQLQAVHTTFKITFI